MARAEEAALAAELGRELAGARRDLAAAGADAPARLRALRRAAGKMEELGLAPVELVGGRAEGREHAWLEAGGVWADPVGSALWGGPPAGPAPHPRCPRPAWREPWRAPRRGA